MSAEQTTGRAAARAGEGDGKGDEQGRPYHHGDLRAALVRAGLAILAEEGAQALTLRAAARRAGVSHNAPYRHFADKEALLAAIAEEGFVELGARLEEARARVSGLPGSARAQLEETGWAYVRFALTHPDHVRVMFGSLVADQGRYPGLRAAGARAFDVLVQIIRAGQAAGAVIAGEPRQVAFAAWGMVHGLALLLIDRQVPAALRAGDDGDDGDGQEALVRLCLRQHYEGLQPRAGG
jgi:AcrR family transcriptional regulator